MEKLSIDSFIKGLISRVSPDKIPVDAMSECVNVDLSEKYIPKSIKGYQKYINTPIVADKPIKGGIIYNNNESGELIVVACGGYIWWAPLGTTTFTKYQINGEDLIIDENVNVEFCQYNNELFIVNGLFPVIKNTGYETSCILIINKYTPRVLNRTNYYAWNYGGDTYYTESATPEAADKIYSDKYGTESGVTVSSYDAETDTITGSDSNDYTRLSTADQNNSATPQGLNYIFIHQERLFGLSSIDDPNGIYWSQPYDPYTWIPIYGLNYDTVGKDDGERISGGATFGGPYLYIFKPHNVYRYITSGDIDQWASNKVDTDYGCVSHRTIKLFEGNLVYLSSNGVVKLNGNTAVLIDDAIRNKTTNLTIGSGITVERSYTKKEQFNLGATLNGIIIANNTIKPVKDFNINEFEDNAETIGQYLFCDNTNVRCDMRIQFENTTTPTSDILAAGTYNIGGSEVLSQNFIFKISQIRDFPLYNLQLYITNKSIANGKNGRIYLQVLDNYNGNVLYTSSSINYSSITTSAWNNFTFSDVNLTGNTTYWIKVIGYCEEQVSGYGYSMAVKCDTYALTGDGYTKELNNTYTLNNLAPGLKYNTALDLDDYSYISNEIDMLTTDGFNLQNIVKTVLAGQSYGTYTIKITVANYPTTSVSWEGIDSAYKTEYTLTNEDSDTITIDNAAADRFLRYKIEFTSGFYGIQNLFFKTADDYNFESEAIRIAGSNPKGWGIANFTKTGSEDAGNLVKIYMRCADNTGELATATYYELFNNVLIDEDMPFKQYVQFKAEFPENSDNILSQIKINFLTTETIVTPCAAVWKTKYILNMPEDNESINNAIEYIYDKDGYWITKDNETNFIYFKSANNLFAGSIDDGIIRYKDTGYVNDDTAYTCYFVTKEFALSDVINLFRKMKVRYISNTNSVTVSVSVDNGAYVDYTLNAVTDLTEIIKTFTGIVRGQTIKFKFSWQSNEYTQIHSIVLLWTKLRELNIA